MTKLKLAALLLLTLLSLTLTSCLGADKETDISYDPKTDTFHIIRVYYNIHGSTPAELAYLGSLYDNRRDIIPGEEQVIAIFGNDNAYLRYDAKHYDIISLGEASTQPAKHTVSPVDLNAIANKPGHFFLSDDAGGQTLCYYHQFDIPGPLADALLGQVNLQIDDSINQTMTTEIARRKAGGALGNWEDVRTAMLKFGASSTSEPAPDTQPAADDKNKLEKDNPVMCLDAESLNLLQKAAAAKHPVVTRAGSLFTVTLELTAADRNQIKATLDALKKKVIELQAKKDQPDAERKMQEGIAAFLDITKLAIAPENRISLSADFIEIQNLLAKFTADTRFATKPDETKKADYQATIDAAKAHGIPIDPAIKINDILARFKKGDLPIDHENKATGEGLFIPADAPK